MMSPSKMTRDPVSLCRISSWSVLAETSMFSTEGVTVNKMESGLMPRPFLMSEVIVEGFFDCATLERKILSEVAASYVMNFARSVPWKRPAYRGPRC